MFVLVVVNGRPRSGKDTTIGFMIDRLKSIGIPSKTLSSIDGVRSMLRSAGFAVDQKGPAERDLMSEVGAATEKYNQFRTNGVAKDAKSFFDACGLPYGVLFVQMREPELIRRLVPKVVDRRTIVRSMIVRSNHELRVRSNRSDRDVDQATYDWEIRNDHNLEDLELRAIAHVDASILPLTEFQPEPSK